MSRRLCAHLALFLLPAATAHAAPPREARAVDPRDDHPSWAYQTARRFHERADFEAAAFWYEIHAHTSPDALRSSQALSEAIELRLALGHEGEAERDAATLAQRWRRGEPPAAARLALRLAEHDASRERWVQARQRLESSMGQIDRWLTLTEKLRAHAALGRTLARVGVEREATREFQKVRAMWQKSGPHTAPGPADELARDAVGEASFYLAERSRQQTERLAAPRFEGPPTREAILDHLSNRLAPWIPRKREAIGRTAEAYAVAVDPEQSTPRWLIASADRVGHLWSDFVHDVRSAPVPPFTPPIVLPRNAYINVLDDSTEPFKLRAREAFGLCLDTSIRARIFDEHSRSCEAWLSRMYPWEFHPVEELHPAPDLAPAQPLAHAAPLTLGGLRGGD